MCCPSATLVVWSAAWLHGRAPADDVLDAMATWADGHVLTTSDPQAAAALEISAGAPASLVHLFSALRTRDVATPALALPAPGDVRGLGGAGQVVPAAVDAGQAALFGALEIALVPTRDAQDVMTWTAYPLGSGPAMPVSLADAEFDLAQALRDSADTLASLDVARERSGVRDELRSTLRSLPRAPLPAHMPGRSLRVLHRADDIAAILTVADNDDPGGAVSARSAAMRHEALRPLANAVRAARCAAVNEAARSFATRHQPHVD